MENKIMEKCEHCPLHLLVLHLHLFLQVNPRAQWVVNPLKCSLVLGCGCEELHTESVCV